MASDSDYADGKYGHGMMIIQVLRDFLDKELYYYAYINNVKSFPKLHLNDFVPSYLSGRESIETIISSFLTQLQVCQN